MCQSIRVGVHTTTDRIGRVPRVECTLYLSDYTCRDGLGRADFSDYWRLAPDRPPVQIGVHTTTGPTGRDRRGKQLLYLPDYTCRDGLVVGKKERPCE